MGRIGHIAHMEKTKTAYGVSVWKPERKRIFPRPGRRRDDNIKIDLQEIEREGVD
jgi:hypothetical protein